MPAAQMEAVPTVDFSQFREGGAKREVGENIVKAFSTIGFVTLINHGIPLELIERTFGESKKFFALPRDVKASFKYQSPQSNRGYIAVGMERLENLPDLKESFDIGDEKDTAYENRWPTHELPSFRATMLEYFAQFDLLHLDVMRAIALGLGFDQEFFTSTNDENHQNLRLLHYPEIDRARIGPGGQKRGGEHCSCSLV